MSDDSNVATSAIGIIEAACNYARMGLRIFPVHAANKSPLPGYGWAALASDKINEVVEDFDRAIQEWGHDFVSVAWALGLNDCVAIDLDTINEPEWVADVEPAAAVNRTRRGRHLIFRNPPEMTPGNGISNFPTHVGFDVRGVGGYIIVAGPDRPGLDPTTIATCGVFPHPEWLSPYGGYTNAATKAEVLQFAKAHSTSKGAQYLNWLSTAMATQWHPENAGTPGVGRHPLACEWLAKAAEESQLGLYPFADAVRLIKAWWHQVTPNEQHRWDREWEGMMSWAVGRALAKATDPPTDGADEDESPDLPGDNSPYVDWATFWTDDVGEHEWLIEGFWPAGRAVLLHAPAKTGKSLFALYCAVELALGVRLDSGEQFRPPGGELFPVMYVDYEMTDADLRERLMEFGIGPQHDLSNLYYTLLTSEFGSLDTPGGASLFLAEVDRIKPKVVILDTFGRAVDGDENDADTVRHFFAHAGRPLRQRGISYLRVDHTGKDSSKGARGSSAKNDDVDLIWSMQQTSEGFQVKSKSRVSWVPPVANWSRHVTAERIFYSRSVEMAELVADEQTTAKVYELERLGIDWTWGRDAVVKELVRLGHKPGRLTVLSAAIKYRRERKQANPNAVFVEPVDNAGGWAEAVDNPREQVGEHDDEPY
jgi:hypothetical protein